MLPYGRRTVALELLYGIATVCLIAMANLEMETVISPRYNPTATRTACKDRDTHYGDPEAAASISRLRGRTTVVP